LLPSLLPSRYYVHFCTVISKNTDCQVLAAKFEGMKALKRGPTVTTYTEYLVWSQLTGHSLNLLKDADGQNCVQSVHMQCFSPLCKCHCHLKQEKRFHLHVRVCQID